MKKNKNIFRELVYKEKSRCGDFGVNKKGTVDQILYDEYLLKRVDLYPEKPLFSKRITKTLNDAHFVCTLMLYSPYLNEELDYFTSNVSLPSVAMPLVHFYLSKVSKRTVLINRYIIMIETVAEGDAKWKKNLEDIKELEGKYEIPIKPSFFPRREIDSEFLSTINWWEGTKHYNKERIRNILLYIPKDEKERSMIADAITNMIMSTDYAKRPDCIRDNEGNIEDVMFPPKSDESQEIYDLCDDIKENYKTYLAEKQKLLVDEQEIAEDLQESNSSSTEEDEGGSDKDNFIFVANLKEPAIASEIKKLNNYNPENRRFAKTVHEMFKELGWLSSYTMTKFLEWGRTQGIFTFTSKIKGFKVDTVMQQKINGYINHFVDKQDDDYIPKIKFRKKDKLKNPLNVSLNKKE